MTNLSERVSVLAMLIGVAIACSSEQSSHSDGVSGGADSGGSGTMGPLGGSGSEGLGGGSALGGNTASGGTATGGATLSGGAPTTGGSGSTGGSLTGGGGNSGSGGATGSGGAPGNGGGGVSESGGANPTGGTGLVPGGTGGVEPGGAGGVASLGGSAGAESSTGGQESSVSYELPPPDKCHDLDYQPWTDDPTTGCVDGDPSSMCGGKCQTASACEDTSSKPNADVEFMCQRNLLFSPEMEQAVVDDGLQGFHYAVVGHDPDPGGIDAGAHTCCQCYQLVYAYPSPNNDMQALVDPNNRESPVSAIPIPPPLIVQSFNTAASPTTFDVYMPAGGMGANNGCYPVNSGPPAGSGEYMYTSYPPDGQPGSGGVKPASLYQECKTETSWVTEASLTTPACLERTGAACDQIASDIPGLTEQARSGCLKANTVDSFYHLNWSVYAMRVECPEHLTRVTGCKLAAQADVKPVKPDVKTAQQAAADPDFWSRTGSSSDLYETTTMEDCCRPTCASYSQISNFGLVTDPDYRSFYNCDVNGVPWTQPQ